MSDYMYRMNHLDFGPNVEVGICTDGTYDVMIIGKDPENGLQMKVRLKLLSLVELIQQMSAKWVEETVVVRHLRSLGYRVSKPSGLMDMLGL